MQSDRVVEHRHHQDCAAADQVRRHRAVPGAEAIDKRAAEYAGKEGRQEGERAGQARLPALPVVSSTNHGIATAVSELPTSEIALATISE